MSNYQIQATLALTGESITLCKAATPENAELIKSALEKTESPFSKVEIIGETKKTESILLCIDTHQVDLAWELQKWLKEREVSCVICFSKLDFELIKEAYVSVGSPHMIVQAGRHATWNLLDFDLKLGDFDRDSFETIYDILD